MDGFSIGIAWQGNPRYRRDHQRSFRLAQLEPLAQVSPACGSSVFKRELGTEQIAELGERFSVSDLGSRFTDFMDTAAVMRNLDLVITSGFVTGAPGRGAGCPDLGGDPHCRRLALADRTRR